MNPIHLATTNAHAPAVPASAAPNPIATALVNQTAQAPALPQPQTWFQVHASWATHGIAGIFIFAAISLVILLAIQTTKQEGLSGTIGGRVESTYSRMGAEDQLKRITGVVAVAFVLLFTVLSLTGI